VNLDERTSGTLRDLLTFADMAERLVARGKAKYDYEILWNGLAGRLPTEIQHIRAVVAADGQGQ
jgi:hypothetical protein